MSKVKVAPSILSADFAKMAEAVQNLDKWHADVIHCDVMDGVFVPNITFGMDMIKALRKYTNGILDVHLMIIKPEKYIPQFIAAGADVITFHPDASDDVAGALKTIKDAGKKCGLVLNPDKPLSMIEPYLDIIDVVIIMGVYAGFGGQSFIPETLDKIRECKKLIGNRNIEIEMDGGASPKNFKDLKEAGTDIIVAGSAVFKAEDPALSSKYTTFKEHIMADKEKEILEENYNLDEDFEDEEEIVTLHNENTDKDEDFRVVWYIEDGGKNYLFLNPVDPSDDIAEDEVLICEYGETKNGEEFVNPVDDEKELERIYNLYVKEYEEAAKDE